MSDFLFHKVSESEKESIKKQAKEIMDRFSEKLARIDKKTSEPIIERKNFERHEMQGSKPNLDFRKRMFENAPNKNDDFILGEKKGW
jgi:Asp-tRNA(Asn)/Glu-tRNA(Gln) amidotransferase C subunit